MKKWDDLSYEERKEINTLFVNWLEGYTHEVVIKVLARSEEIINNDFAMNLLKELKERKDKEAHDLTNSIEMLLGNFETFKEYDVHNHPLTHSGSYKDILYDMYIK